MSACGAEGTPASPDGAAPSVDAGATFDAVAPADASSMTAEPDAAPECGNGTPEVGEICDDGNLISGDGCNETCTMMDQWDLVANVHTAGDQRSPALGCDADHVVIAYTDWSGTDGDGAGVFVRLLGRDGMPLVSSHGDDQEFVANSTVTGHQTAPRVAVGVGGSFFVVWQDDSGEAPDARGRTFAARGEMLAEDFQLSDDNTGLQATPDVAITEQGIALAVWVDDSDTSADSSGFGIRGRLFNSNGSPQQNTQTNTTGSFQINQTLTGNQIQPAVAWTGTHFLVTWADQSHQHDSDGYGIAGILLDSQGTIAGVGGEFPINTTTAGNQASPRIAVQGGLGVLVAWNDDSQSVDPQSHGVRGRLLAPDGSARGNPLTGADDDFQVNTTYAASQQLPATVASDDGTLLVAWHDWSAEDGSGAGIRARLLDSSGLPITVNTDDGASDYPLNTTWLDSQLTPSLCSIGDGFIAAWEDHSQSTPDESGASIRYRMVALPTTGGN